MYRAKVTTPKITTDNIGDVVTIACDVTRPSPTQATLLLGFCNAGKRLVNERPLELESLWKGLAGMAGRNRKEVDKLEDKKAGKRAAKVRDAVK